MKSYDYENRDGIMEMDWPWFAALAQQLAGVLAAEGVDTVVGIARAGLVPAATIACALRCDLIPVRVTCREQDIVTHVAPQWKVDVAPEVAGRVVAVIDEMADTGATLAMVAARVHERGAARVVTASLCAHSWADPAPTHAALATDALVIFPWDRQVLVDGRWELHPELEQAIRATAGSGARAMNRTNSEAYWQAFLATLPEDAPAHTATYTAEPFGDNPALADELGALVLAGKKTATCSALWEWEAEGNPVTKVGSFWIVLDGRGEPLCIVEAVEVAFRRYDEVDATFAYEEGEGNRSLQYWRDAHRRFFTRTLAAIGKEFAPDMPLVCERFRVVYRGEV